MMGHMHLAGSAGATANLPASWLLSAGIFLIGAAAVALVLTSIPLIFVSLLAMLEYLDDYTHWFFT